MYKKWSTNVFFSCLFVCLDGEPGDVGALGIFRNQRGSLRAEKRFLFQYSCASFFVYRRCRMLAMGGNFVNLR